MSNIDQAGQVIYDEVYQTWERGEILTVAGEAERIAKALADAGLLAPDLPDANATDIFVPDGKGWLPCGLTGPSVWTAPGGRIMVQRVEPGDLTPAEARFFALALLAAAQYAKEEAVRTLADMTPQERAQCRGMWCDTPKGRFILLAPMFPDCEAFGWELLIPSAGMKIDYLPEKITPLPDLPRAWTPDGTPPAGEWQTGKVKIIPNENAKYDPALNVITGDAVVDHDHEPREAHDIRRWVGEWEEA